MLFISDRTLQHWRSRDIIPYSHIGKQDLVPVIMPNGIVEVIFNFSDSSL